MVSDTSLNVAGKVLYIIYILYIGLYFIYRAFQVVLVVKNPPANPGDTRDTGSVPRLGRSSGEGNGNPLQYSCLENPVDRGAWWSYTPWGHKDSDTTARTHLLLILFLWRTLPRLTHNPKW